MCNKDFFIRSNGDTRFAVKTINGFEFMSNDRKMNIVIEKRVNYNTVNNVQSDTFTTACWVLTDNGWERGDNSANINSIEEYVNRLDLSPYFTKAVSEYRQYLINATKQHGKSNQMF